MLNGSPENTLAASSAQGCRMKEGDALWAWRMKGGAGGADGETDDEEEECKDEEEGEEEEEEEHCVDGLVPSGVGVDVDVDSVVNSDLGLSSDTLTLIL